MINSDDYEAEWSKIVDKFPAKEVDDEPMDEPVKAESEVAVASRAEKDAIMADFSDGFNAPDAAPAAMPEAKPVAKQSFGQAFKAARAGGSKTFEFNGKQYSTALKSDKPAAKAAPVAVPSAGSQMPAPRADQAQPAAPARRPSIYEAEHPIRDGIKAIKKAAGFVADGGLNLTAKK